MFTNLSTYGYIALFIYSLGGGFIGLIAAGVLSFAGKMDLTTSMAVAFISNFIGDMLLFYLARHEKANVMEYFKKHKRKLAYSHALIKKHGSKVIFIQKFVYGIKTLIPIAIGLTKFDQKQFIVLNLIASFVWTLAIGYASYAAGSAILSGYEQVIDKPYLAPVILITLLALTWGFLTFVTKKRKT